MLKIKDEVDLKELEKFGFKYSYSKWGKEVEEHYINDEAHIFIYVDYPTNMNGTKMTRHFPRKLKTYKFANENTDDTLYDLITAGLVEKV